MPDSPTVTSTGETLSRRIKEVLRISDPIESADLAKEYAAKIIKLADDQVDIKKTSYFNNTYTPDLVLRWPGTSLERGVFIRTSPELGWLQEDLALVPAETSMLLQVDADLERNSNDSADEDAAVDRAAAERGVLITQTESVEEVGGRGHDKSAVALFTSSLLRGGRGFIDAARTSDLIGTVEAGFLGAQFGDAEATARVLLTTDRYLARSEDRRITEVLQLLWVGGGSSATSFPPSESEAIANLDAASLRFLLENQDLTDGSFWNRVAKSATLDIIIGLRDMDGATLNNLVTAAAPGLRAKACASRRRAAPEGAGPKIPYWSVRDGLLCLDFGLTTFAVHKKRAPVSEAAGATYPISVESLLSRADASGDRIIDLKLSHNGRQIRITDSLGDLGAVATEAAATLNTTDPVVDRAAVTTSRGLSFGIEPESGIIYGRSNSNPLMTDLIETSAILTVGLNGEDLDGLANFLGIDNLKYDSIMQVGEQAAGDRTISFSANAPKQIAGPDH